ncbi:MAG: hypothetical protein AAFN10_18750 [Bacteroidota bacterium]
MFVLLHLFNHMLAWGGIALHQSFMDAFRILYRHPLGESILFSLIIAQIISGISQIKQIPKAARQQNRLQIYSGLYLLFFLLAHTSAVQIGRYISALDTNFYFASIVLLDQSSRLFFIPYYTLGILAFFAHIGTGLRWYLPQQYQKPLVWGLLGLGLIVALSIIALFSGWVYDVPRLAEYEKSLLF